VPPPELPLTMPRLVADVAEVLNRLGVEAAHFVGVAMGGGVAQNFALAAPARVRSLCLFGSLPGLAGSQVRQWPARIAGEGLRAFVAATLAERFDPARSDPALLRWFVDDCARSDADFVIRYLTLMAELDWSDQLARIVCPTLLVMPGAETIGGGARYQYMRECLPDARLLVYEGMPHNVCDADPDRAAADVLSFLRTRFGDTLGA
jgi:pimeloyl-ACP methyl ester carboxylesterase